MGKQHVPALSGTRRETVQTSALQLKCMHYITTCFITSFQPVFPGDNLPGHTRDCMVRSWGGQSPSQTALIILDTH